MSHAPRTAQDLLSDASRRTDAALDRVLPRDDASPVDVHRAMRYSVFSGGKRLRPALALTTAQALGFDPRSNWSTPSA
jgi:geranylgeranyl diphosphate synthase, type II